MSKTGWIDVTMPIANGMVHWPGDEPVNITLISSIDEGDEANVTHISMTAHTGTHMDAPVHFLPGGASISDLTPDDFIGPVKVCHITDPRQITFGELKEMDISQGDRIFFRTRNSDIDWNGKPFRDEFVGLSTNGAKYLAKLGVRCIGVDYLSVSMEENGAEVHESLLGADIVIIEGLNLKEVLPGVYDMIALPMNILGADGAPARVLLRRIDGEMEREIPA